MEKQDFSTTLVGDQTPKQVFNAIINPQNWWPGEVKGSSEKIDDEFEYRYKAFHFSRQRVVEIIPDQKVTWLVTNSIINYVEDKEEWTGTRISFEISRKDNKTQLK